MKAKIDDLRQVIEARKAATTAAHARADLVRTVDGVLAGYVPEGQLADALGRAKAAQQASWAAENAVARIPAARRYAAKRTAAAAEEIALRALSAMGGQYSGRTQYTVTWGDTATAGTTTSYGDRYSSRCKWSKTDAAHHATICPEGAVGLVERAEIEEASRADGLPLISLRDDGAAVWLTTKGKAVVAVSGWVAFERGICYHSTQSRSDAETGLAKKLAKLQQVAERARREAVANRRARLIARMCPGAVATIADARALGYCEPGIRQFQERYHVGDSAPLPTLIATGHPSAVRLALHVARSYARSASGGQKANSHQCLSARTACGPRNCPSEQQT
jgi:hypothetical protein